MCAMRGEQFNIYSLHFYLLHLPRFCYCSFFPPGWLSFAAHNPRFASWQAFEAGIAFPDPQPASRQHYTRRRELYQACSALLLAARAADAADAAS